MAPAFAAVAATRRTRSLHPSGIVLRAEVTAVPADRELGMAAERLGTHAVVRFSSALWKRGDRWPDVLGCAIRFCAPGRELNPALGDQDLLLATLRSPFTLFVAPFLTRPADFTANEFHAASPFWIEGVGKAKLSARWEMGTGSFSERRSSPGPRAERLIDRVERGAARLALFLHRPGSRQWERLVELNLVEQLQLDQNALRFDPFLTGRGLEPTGFVHSMRRAAYPASRGATRALRQVEA